MVKQCPEHGVFTSMVERDPKWFNYCQKLNCKGIYDGYLLDVTSKCNLKCKYCYHDNNGKERSAGSIIADGFEHRDCKLFVLTGGEPTLHPELDKIITGLKLFGEVSLLTNGIKLTDENYFNKIIPLLETDLGVNIGLSLHKESQGKDFEFLNLCRKWGKIIATVFFVIDDIQQIDEALEIFRSYKDVIASMRIKAASNLGAERKADNKIFISDMLNYLCSKGQTQVVTGTNDAGYTYNNKVSFANVVHDGMHLMLISWYDVNNIDLNDINCPPYYKASDGNVYDLVQTCLVNEGMEKKKGINVRRAYPCDIPQCGELWQEMAIEERGIKPDASIWMSQISEFIRNENNHFNVGEYDGQVVGFVTGTCDTIDPVTGETVIVGIQFYIQPEFRKTGIAQKMHDEYLKYAIKHGAKRVIRRVTQEHSKELIQKKGYVITDVIVEETVEGVVCR